MPSEARFLANRRLIYPVIPAFHSRGDGRGRRGNCAKQSQFAGVQNGPNYRAEKGL